VAEPSKAPDFRRLAAWGLLAFAALAGLGGWLSREAAADLAFGRERLLAGQPSAAAAAFARARRWPASAEAARAGGTVAAALAEEAMEDDPVPLVHLEALGAEALLASAVEDGRLEGAARLASLARRAGHPLGALYAAALAFDGGDEARARALAAASRAPLASRGIGSRLKRALEALDAGAMTLVLDRRGELAATVGPGPDARLTPTPAAAPLLAGALERLEAMPSGPAVRLSLDLDLSRLALWALGEARGAIVLVEPGTGAVLAAVADARTAAAEKAAPFEQRREPASIAKLLTAAAAYRAGLDVDEETRGTRCTGVERFGGQPLWCAYPSGRLAGFDHALAESCNVAFASLGVRLGAERLVDEYRRWGFDGAAGTLLGAAGRIHTPPRTPRQLADLAVGLELSDVTPLHAALLAATVANDGSLPAPRLLRGACSPLGLTDDPRGPAAARPVLEPRIARRLRAAMEAVVAYGTAMGLGAPGFRVAMKTGTASEWRLGYHVNYIGMGPLPEPSVAFCVRVTHLGSSPVATGAARDVTRRLLAGLAQKTLRTGRPRPPGPPRE
jgi:peptidoglycan glycosyltransferase